MSFVNDQQHVEETLDANVSRLSYTSQGWWQEVIIYLFFVLFDIKTIPPPLLQR